MKNKTNTNNQQIIKDAIKSSKNQKQTIKNYACDKDQVKDLKQVVYSDFPEHKQYLDNFLFPLFPFFEIYSSQTIYFGPEPNPKAIKEQIKSSTNIKKYIVGYIKEYGQTNRLSDIITNDFPQHIDTLNKFLLLK